MKYLIILLLFYSCRTSPEFIVSKVQSTTSGICDYGIHQTGDGPVDFITITDSCGLYQVGDTLKLIKK